MKRYYFLSDVDHAALLKGSVYPREWHGLDLGSIGSGAGAGLHAVVIPDGAAAVPSTWVRMGHLLDTSATMGNHAAALKAIAPNASLNGMLSDLGLTALSTMFAAAQALAAIHPQFEP